MIALRGLRYAYARAAELSFPDVAVAPGGTLLVRGPSGSGKSTLLALLAGLLSPRAGQVCVAGTEVQTLPAAERDRWRGATLGFMPQRLHLSASLSVAGNLALPFVCAGLAVDGDAVARGLRRLGLAALAAREPHQLSLGQAQRVALARALIRRPKVIVADEPTANLDDASAAAVLDLLCETCAEAGSTLVIASHDGRVFARASNDAVSLTLA